MLVLVLSTEQAFASSRWWTKMLYGHTRIKDLYIPGTHNSAAVGTMNKWDHLDCQEDTVGQQLRKGIRFFDLRYTIGDDKGWYIAHGFHQYDTPFLQVTAAINQFVRQNAWDFAIIRVKNENGDNDKDAALIAKIGCVERSAGTMDVIDVTQARSDKLICIRTGRWNTLAHQDFYKAQVDEKVIAATEFLYKRSSKFWTNYLSTNAHLEWSATGLVAMTQSPLGGVAIMHQSIGQIAKSVNKKMWGIMSHIYKTRSYTDWAHARGSGVYVMDAANEALTDLIVMFNCKWNTKKGFSKYDTYCEREIKDFGHNYYLSDPDSDTPSDIVHDFRYVMGNAQRFHRLCDDCGWFDACSGPSLQPWDSIKDADISTETWRTIRGIGSLCYSNV
jgi:Phosphatidylinositol-specific phospholipase C, X domain